MQKLLLTLTILTGAGSLHGMESSFAPTFVKVRSADKQNDDSAIDYSKLSPITLPQIYHHLAEVLLPEIAQHIFSLQPGTSQINKKISLRRKRKEGEMSSIVERLKSDMYIRLHFLYGHCLSVEVLKRNLLRKNISICEIINDYSNETVLHAAAHDGCTEDAKLYLEVAGNGVLTLLTTQTNFGHHTALHIAAHCGHVEIVKLLLDAASNNVQDFVNIRNIDEKTALDFATPEVQKFMQQYLQK